MDRYLSTERTRNRPRGSTRGARGRRAQTLRLEMSRRHWVEKHVSVDINFYVGLRLFVSLLMLCGAIASFAWRCFGHPCEVVSQLSAVALIQNVSTCQLRGRAHLRATHSGMQHSKPAFAVRAPVGPPTPPQRLLARGLPVGTSLAPQRAPWRRRQALLYRCRWACLRQAQRQGWTRKAPRLRRRLTFHSRPLRRQRRRLPGLGSTRSWCARLRRFRPTAASPLPGAPERGCAGAFAECGGALAQH